MNRLFEPITLGSVELANRIVMAPMTRGRADAGAVPTAAMAEYYGLRAAAGLLIGEATYVSSRARGWNGAPGIYTAEQIEGWRGVTNKVHRAGGRIGCQLWFIGRVSHPVFLAGTRPWGPSAIAARHHVHASDGRRLDCVTPHAMTHGEIAAAVADFEQAARNALAAGFDCIQIHAASGYLPDQFLRDGVNRRTDAYGGSPHNRMRFLMEIVEACCGAVGSDRVAVRLSPRNPYNDIGDSDPDGLFPLVAERLSAFSLAFLEVVEGLPGSFMHFKGAPLAGAMKRAFGGPLVVNGGYDAIAADQAISEGVADAVSFGIPFIANPDLVARFLAGVPLNAADAATFYTPGEPGYLDYPSLEDGPVSGETYRSLSLSEAAKH